jgi:hypothetical protein
MGISGGSQEAAKLPRQVRYQVQLGNEGMVRRQVRYQVQLGNEGMVRRQMLYQVQLGNEGMDWRSFTFERPCLETVGAV